MTLLIINFMPKSTKSILFITILIAAALGLGLYYSQQSPSNNNEQPEEINNIENPTTTNEIMFDNINEYVSLILNTNTNSSYQTTKPAEYKRINFGGIELNVAPDGVSTDVFVLEPPTGITNLDQIETFYLEVVGPSPCWTELDCEEPNTVDYYGPFQGKLGRLTQ